MSRIPKKSAHLFDVLQIKEKALSQQGLFQLKIKIINIELTRPQTHTGSLAL